VLNITVPSGKSISLGAGATMTTPGWLGIVGFTGVDVTDQPLHFNYLNCDNSSSGAVVLEPYAHKYGDMGTETKSWRNIWADNHWSSSPKVLKKPGYLKDIEGFKVKWENEEDGEWDYLTLPQPKGNKHNGLCLTEVLSWLLCAMGEVKGRLEALEVRA